MPNVILKEELSCFIQTRQCVIINYAKYMRELVEFLSGNFVSCKVLAFLFAELTGMFSQYLQEGLFWQMKQ